MAKIISFGDEPPNLQNQLERQGIFNYLISLYKSFDRFTKLFIIAIAFIAAATPSIISGYFIYIQHASGGNIGTAASGTSSVTRNNQKYLDSYCPVSSTYTTYNLDFSIVNMLALMNQYRASKGLPALTPDVTLTNIAQWMSNDMATHNYMSHTDSLGRTPGVRDSQMGYACWAWGEILAEGFGGDPAATLTAWENSAEHNAIILGTYKAVGLYRAYSASSTYGYYWAGEFGSTVDKPTIYIGINPSPTPTPTPFCLINCTSPTPTPNPTATPAPTQNPTPTSSSTCTPGLTQCVGGGTGYCPTSHLYYQICNSNGAWANSANCPSGEYPYAFGNSAGCTAPCSGHGTDVCATSCSSPQPNLTQFTFPDYACSTAGTTCCLPTTATPTPTPISTCTYGYVDNDGDGYGTGAYGCYTGKVAALGGDCCDSDSRAHPGQTAAFTTPDNCGSYDYNCNGTSSIVGTYYALSGLTSSVRLNCVGGTCGSCTNGNYTPPFKNSYTTACGQPGGVNCSYAYFNPGLTYCPASGNASYRAGCTSTVTACN